MSSAPLPDPGPRFRVVGYVGGRTNFEAIDAQKLTHINYAFAKVRPDDTVVLENENDAEHLTRLRALKQVNPKLKVILSVGGWGAEWFSDAALTDASRCRFATSAVALMKEHRLDGLDIDWEYPGQIGAGNRNRPEDKQNFTLLLEAVRRELDLHGDYSLSIATTGGRYFRYTEMDRVHPHVDWINVMAYDMAGGWSEGTAHHAPLHADRASAEAYVLQHLQAGIPASKIVVGVPFYGRMWKWVINRKSPTGLNEPFDWFVPDVPWTALERDYIAKFDRRWDDAAKAPYLWDAEHGTFISYEDPQSLRAKAEFVKTRALGGVMFWEHRHDPSGTLLGAVASVLLPPPAEPRRRRGDRESPDRTASGSDSPDSRDARPGSGSRR